MVLTSYKGMSTLSSHVVTGVLMVLTSYKGMSTLSSTVTHESPRVLYNHRQIHSQELVLNSCIECNLIGSKPPTYPSLHVTSSSLNQAPWLDERWYSSLNDCTIPVTTTPPVTERLKFSRSQNLYDRAVSSQLHNTVPLLNCDQLLNKSQNQN